MPNTPLRKVKEKTDFQNINALMLAVILNRGRVTRVLPTSLPLFKWVQLSLKKNLLQEVKIVHFSLGSHMGCFLPACNFFSPVLMFVLSTPTSFYPMDAIDLRSFSLNEIWCSLHSSAFASTPTVVMNPEGIGCPLWLRPEHSWLLVLPENVIRTCPPPLPPLCFAFLFFF